MCEHERIVVLAEKGKDSLTICLDCCQSRDADNFWVVRCLLVDRRS